MEILSKAPPYPADLEAKGWSLDLDYERIEQSDTWAIASPEQRPWLLMLWLVSWRQVPAASLPNNHRLIAARLGMPESKFAEWADVLLSGWELCTDGRLYHKTLTEHVLRMAAKRTKDRERVANYRAKSQQSNDDVDSCNALHTSDQRVSSTPTPTPTPTPADKDKDKEGRSRKRSRPANDVDFVLPEWINRQHWDAWHSCPKRKKATNAQKQMAVDKLAAWRERGIDYAAALENAAIGGWQGLFEPDQKMAAQPIRRAVKGVVISDEDREAYSRAQAEEAKRLLFGDAKKDDSTVIDMPVTFLGMTNATK